MMNTTKPIPTPAHLRLLPKTPAKSQQPGDWAFIVLFALLTAAVYGPIVYFVARRISR